MTSEGQNEKDAWQLAVEDLSVVIGGENVLGHSAPQLHVENHDARAQALAKRIAELRVRIGTLLKTDNVSFLLGAGCSIGAGGVSLARIPPEIEELLITRGRVGTGRYSSWIRLFYSALTAIAREVLEADNSEQAGLQGLQTSRLVVEDRLGQETMPVPLNLELVLTRLHAWLNAMSAGSGVHFARGIGFRGRELEKEDLENLVRQLTGALTEACRLPKVGKKNHLGHYERFLKKLLTRPLNLRRGNLFTLNYDTLVEQAADALGVVLIDGFVGSSRRVFRPERFDQDLYFPAQTTEGRVHRLDRVLHLYKLHGSINWLSEPLSFDNPYGVRALTDLNSREERRTLIYPTPRKYGETLGMPYAELFRRFAQAIIQPQSVLFVMGYSFGDEHVNSIINQALAVPSFTLVVVNPEMKGDYLNRLRESADPRVWLISGWGDQTQNVPALGTFEGFIGHLLPDLRAEEIDRRVVATVRSLIGTSVQESDDQLQEGA